MLDRQRNGVEWWLANRGIPFSPEIDGFGDDPQAVDEATKVLLATMMTNIDKPVTVFTDTMPVEDSAALFARYSRSALPLRLVYVNEFLGQNEKRRDFFEKVLVAFGDDSVAQLGTVRFACEMVSQLAVKDIENGRLGSYLEKSTRYKDWGKKINGCYMYLRAPEIMQSEFAGEYTETMDEAFGLYAAGVGAMMEHLRKKFPIKAGEKEVVYEQAIRAKAFDIVRVFLPMSTLTNVGAVMSAQAVEDMINKMRVSPRAETRMMGEELFEEVLQVFPSLVSREKDEKYGSRKRQQLESSTAETERVSNLLMQKLEQKKEAIRPGVELVGATDSNLDRVAAAILYRHASGSSLTQLQNLVRELSVAEKAELVEAYVSGRTDRRHKPGRAFEEAVYQFDFVTKVAEYRDLQRHRMLSQERQNFTTELGFVVPEEFAEVYIGGEILADVYSRHMEKRNSLYLKVRDTVSAEVAQYVVGFGNLHRFRMTVNLRELYHMIPLRASAAGHPDYRKIAREMFYLIAEKDPILGRPMQRFIDFSDEPKLDRLEQLERVMNKMLSAGLVDGDTFSQ